MRVFASGGFELTWDEPLKKIIHSRRFSFTVHFDHDEDVDGVLLAFLLEVSKASSDVWVGRFEKVQDIRENGEVITESYVVVHIVTKNSEETKAVSKIIEKFLKKSKEA